MLADFFIRKGDRLPEIVATLQDANGVAVPLTSVSSVHFRMRAPNSATYKVDAAAVITDPFNGQVTYTWATPDTDTAGEYLADWLVTFSDGRSETFPNAGALTIEVIAKDELNWSYTGDPANRPLDAVRLLISDTDSARPQLSDDELAWLLTQETNPYYAAARAAELISSSYSGKSTKTVGDLSISFGELASHYGDLADRLRAQAADPRLSGAVPVPYAGGLSVAEKQGDVADTDLVQPAFRVNQHSSPGRDLSSDAAMWARNN